MLRGTHPACHDGHPLTGRRHQFVRSSWRRLRSQGLNQRWWLAQRLAWLAPNCTQASKTLHSPVQSSKGRKEPIKSQTHYTRQGTASGLRCRKAAKTRTRAEQWEERGFVAWAQPLLLQKQGSADMYYTYKESFLGTSAEIPFQHRNRRIQKNPPKSEKSANNFLFCRNRVFMGCAYL